jgi:hypothetical protein
VNETQQILSLNTLSFEICQLFDLKGSEGLEEDLNDTKFLSEPSPFVGRNDSAKQDNCGLCRLKNMIRNANRKMIWTCFLHTLNSGSVQKT